MSNNTNEPKALVIPDAEQIQRDAELFGVTKQYIDWVEAVATGQQEGTQEDVSNALVFARESITALEANHFIAHAAVAGLQEAVDKLTEQRNEAVTEKAELEANFEEAVQQARDEGFEAGLEDAAYGDYWDEPELDLDEAWQAIKEEMESYVEHLGMKMKLLGQPDAAKDLHTKVQAAIRAYDDADSTIIQYSKYCSEHSEELAAKRSEFAKAQAEKWSAEHPLVEDDDDDTDSDDDENDEAF